MSYCGVKDVPLLYVAPARLKTTLMYTWEPLLTSLTAWAQLAVPVPSVMAEHPSEALLECQVMSTSTPGTWCPLSVIWAKAFTVSSILGVGSLTQADT